MSDSDSSGSASIVIEQANRLFDACDSSGKGFVVQHDLAVLDAYLSDEVTDKIITRLEQEENRYLTKDQFVQFLQPFLRRPPALHRNVPAMQSVDLGDEMPLPDPRRPSLLRMAEVTLADELAVSSRTEAAMAVRDYESPIEEAYPYRVENCSPIEMQVLEPHYEPTSAAIIKRRHFRPLLPDLDDQLPGLPGKMSPPSLADELKAAQNRNGTKRANGGIPPELDMRTPDRIFKVVFVGDSAVGKTCFLHRFCHNRFRPLFNATIGVDFTVKTIQMRDRLLAVQLWDTAGQERFRSITKQYFRKADGVVLMYDVTSEQSFLHVRNWIDSVKQGVDESTVMCLVGNKVDLYANDQARTITYKHGKDIAKEFNMLFFETSAFTGYGIHECMQAMAEKLQKREDDHLEEALKLEMTVDPKQRSWCCV